MVNLHKSFSFCLTVLFLALSSQANAQAPAVDQVKLPAASEVKGERLDPSTYGKTVVEDMAAVLERDRLTTNEQRNNPKARNGKPGSWKVPSLRAMGEAHSGKNHITNGWGDTEIGIRFPEPVDVQGAYFAGLGDPGVWTNELKVIGYRNSKEVSSSDWFTNIGKEPTWFAVNLQGVDRIVVVAGKVINGGGWYTLDDLTYTVAGKTKANQKPIVINFDDLTPGADLSGSNYAGLTWETGTGNFNEDAIQSPSFPIDYVEAIPANNALAAQAASGTNAVAPQLMNQYQGSIRGDAGQFSFPPDTHGAIGPNHFVEVVNTIFSIYNKVDGTLISQTSLGSFLPGSSGDPRILFDQHSNRWVVMVTDFSTKLFVAVSATNDPTGSWTKTNFVASQGFDAGTFPDYPTLGVDKDGIYIAAFMAGNTMTVFVIDKAPLVSGTGLGAITAFRALPWEGAIQPAHTYGNGAGDRQYFVSVSGSSSIRVRRLNGSVTSPTLVTLGFISVPAFGSPPNAPSLGSSVALDSIGTRLMNAVYRNGSIWTTHAKNVGGRSGIQWYELNPVALTLTQTGTIAASAANPGLYYLIPSIMVDSVGNVLLSFSGSKSSMYASVYYTGRLAGDPLGEMAEPVLVKVGTGPQNNVDQFGRNRFGDYSYTSLDPVDETLWSIQEYGHGTNIWGTWLAKYQANSCLPPSGVGFASHSFNITVPAGVDPIALRIDGDPNDPLIACISKYVQADGTLGNTPVFQLPAVWDGILATGSELIPSSDPPAPVREYFVFAECQSTGLVSAGRSVPMTLWADLDNSSDHDIVDIILAINFVTNPPVFPPTFAAVDVGGCQANGELDISDIVQVILIATDYGGSFENSACPRPCS